MRLTDTMLFGGFLLLAACSANSGSDYPPVAKGGSSNAGGTSGSPRGGASNNTGGTTSGSGGSSDQTGGSATNTGGMAATTGGSATNTSGSAATTGGSAATTGGSAATTGGSAVTTGGSAVTTGGSAATTGGTAATTGGTATNTGGTAATTGGSATNTGGSNATGTGGDATCADITTNTTAVPPVLEIAIDVSGSMDDDAYPSDTSNNASKWEEMQRVLPDAFASLPGDWAVGLTFWSKPNACYQGVQAVPIAPLTAAQVTALDDAVARQTTGGYTPTISAWRFALSQLQSWVAPPAYQNSPRKIVLITDGVPTVSRDGCTVMNPITQAEYDAWIGFVEAEGTAAGIDTFVVGVLGSEDPQGATYDPMYMLSRWAVAGHTAPAGCVPQSGTVSRTAVSPRGTYCHFDMTSNPDFAAGLTQALQSIAQQVISCTYQVPVPTDGRIIDPRKIKLTYTPGNGGAPQDLLKATSSACTDGQWFISALDANGTPSELQLCPDTCNTASADNGAQIQVTFTCLEIL